MPGTLASALQASLCRPNWASSRSRLSILASSSRISSSAKRIGVRSIVGIAE
jgi:hypothetical protein